MGGQVDRAGSEHASTGRLRIAIPQHHMHGEVDASLAVLPGAIEGVDDPDPIGGEAHRVIGAFLTEHDVARTHRGQSLDDEFVRCAVGLLAQLVGALLVVYRTEGFAQREEQLPCFGRHAGGHVHVTGGHSLPASGSAL